MAKLEWDKTGERFVENGVSKGVLYPQSADGTYPKGVAWNGLTAVNESPDGADPNDLYADNIKYGSLRGAETFGYSISAFTFPDEWNACDGSAALADGVYIGQQKRQAFGFCWRTEVSNDTAGETDDGYKIHIAYGSTATPSDKNWETINDSPDAQEFEWECDTNPVPVTGHKPTATLVIDSRKVDSAKLTKIENALYGTDDTEAHLPLPDDIIKIMNGTTNP